MFKVVTAPKHRQFVHRQKVNFLPKFDLQEFNCVNSCDRKKGGFIIWARVLWLRMGARNQLAKWTASHVIIVLICLKSRL